MINQTRYLWGAQKYPGPEYSILRTCELKEIPPAQKVVQTETDLVDDLIRRRCTSCHLGVELQGDSGFFRGLGCAASYIFYENDGIYRGKDPVTKGKIGYPREHRFCNPIPVKQCLHCHNGPRTGSGFTGIFEHDFHQSYRTPIQNGLLPERTCLIDHHQLIPDIHYERGLVCIDCHNKGDVMGRGNLQCCEQEAVSIRCTDCHGPFETNKDNKHHPNIYDGRFRSKNGELHRLPHYKTSIAAHSIPQMQKVDCRGCHAAWGFMDYGMILIRDDRKDLSRWSPWRLDHAVSNYFDEQGRFLGPALAPGPWFLGWRFR